MAPKHAESFLREYLDGQFRALNARLDSLEAQRKEDSAETKAVLLTHATDIGVLKVWKANLSGKLALAAMLASGLMTVVWQFVGRWVSRIGDGG